MTQMKTNELLEILSKRYPTLRGEWAFLTQVRSATGFDPVRTADAMALGLWPSRGQHLHGFELKVSRSDFLTELKKPAKADEIGKHCDFWWIVVPDLTVAKLEDMPYNWGLMVVNKGKIVVVKEAPKLDCEPVSKKFLAGILRNVTNGLIPYETIKSRIEDARKSGIEQGERNYKYRLNDFQHLQTKVDEFEKASGVNIQHAWKVRDVGEAVKMVLDGKDKATKERLLRLQTDIHNIAKFVDEALKESQ